MPPRTIVIGAQSYGYGAAGKASAIAASLPGVHKTFVGTTTALDLCQRSAHFDEAVDVVNPRDLDCLHSFDVSLVVSVMNPFLIWWAEANHIPSLFVDSMSGFWDWSDADAVRQSVPLLLAGTFQDGCSLLESFHPYLRNLFAHLLTRRVLSQGTPQTVPETVDKVMDVGAIVDLSFRNEAEADTLLISLSGGVSPEISLDWAIRYGELVSDLASIFAPSWPGVRRVVFTGHPEVLSRLTGGEFSPTNWLGEADHLVPLSHPEFLETVARSVCVVAPCGFTTLFESAAYGAPLAFLPEHHTGHLYEYRALVGDSAALTFPNALMTYGDQMPEALGQSNSAMLDRIRSCISRYFTDHGWQQQLRARVQQWPTQFLQRQEVISSQERAISALVRDFDGAARLARICREEAAI